VLVGRKEGENMTPEVISFTPAWQVITFKDYQEARTILLQKYHGSIIVNTQELCKRYTLADLKHMVLRTLQLDLSAQHVRDMLDMTNREKLSQILWPMLIVTGRQVKNTAYNKNIRSATLPTHVNYYCEFEPGKDPVLDVNYVKLTPQARVLVDMFVEKIVPNNNTGTPHFTFIKYVNQLKEEGLLITKQAAEHIWAYYRQTLIAKGFIEIVKSKL
jgi:hypothetical protein